MHLDAVFLEYFFACVSSGLAAVDEKDVRIARIDYSVAANHNTPAAPILAREF
jgi:hypothetical protein